MFRRRGNEWMIFKLNLWENIDYCYFGEVRRF